MSVKDMISALNALPNTMTYDEYNEYLDSYRVRGHQDLFIKAYKYSKKDKAYKLHTPKSERDYIQLWEYFEEISKNKWIDYARVSLVAQFIYEHRIKCGRNGDELDDYVKAEYLFKLVNYLNQKHLRAIRLRQGDEMEEIINEVNNIFDSAYFTKMNHPELSDFECFLLAEREYCEEKDIDYFEQNLHDFEAAEARHKHREIEKLAYEQYQWRLRNDMLGDHESDWYEAEEYYPRWRMTKRIADYCWNRSINKQEHQGFYWAQACEVIRVLDSKGISYSDMSLYDSQITKVILEVIEKETGFSNESRQITPALT